MQGPRGGGGGVGPRGPGVCECLLLKDLRLSSQRLSSTDRIQSRPPAPHSTHAASHVRQYRIDIIMTVAHPCPHAGSCGLQAWEEERKGGREGSIQANAEGAKKMPLLLFITLQRDCGAPAM